MRIGRNSLILGIPLISRCFWSSFIRSWIDWLSTSRIRARILRQWRNWRRSCRARTYSRRLRRASLGRSHRCGTNGGRLGRWFRIFRKFGTRFLRWSIRLIKWCNGNRRTWALTKSSPAWTSPRSMTTRRVQGILRSRGSAWSSSSLWSATLATTISSSLPWSCLILVPLSTMMNSSITINRNRIFWLSLPPIWFSRWLRFPPFILYFSSRRYSLR